MKDQIIKIKNANSPLLKVLFILIMTLLLMIPNMLIQNLIIERSQRKATIEAEVSKSYGQEQKVMAPILRIPYTVVTENRDGTTFSKTGTISSTPTETDVVGDLNTATRKRSIYQVVVYDADLDIKSKISLPSLTDEAYAQHTFHYDQAHILIGLSDPHGLSDSSTFKINGTSLALNGLSTFRNSNLRYIQSENFTYAPDKPLDVEVELGLRGTKSLMIEPNGIRMKITMNSPWPDPSFVGKQLPVSSDINNGFTSTWITNQYSHDHPAFWVDDHQLKNRDSAFGVNLIQPVSEYGKNSRTAKYALLIISLTFGIFFFFEILQKKRVHPIQYILIGFALTVFYLLLLSITEHLGFDKAYGIASAATIGLIVTYARPILETRKSTGALGILLSGLFTYIFVILQMQEFALLAGSLALFAVLSLVMMLSRKVDWYKLNQPLNNKHESTL